MFLWLVERRVSGGGDESFYIGASCSIDNWGVLDTIVHFILTMNKGVHI